MLIKTRDTLPFNQKIIIKKLFKFKALKKLDNDNMNDNAVIYILCLKLSLFTQGDTLIKHNRRVIDMLHAEMNREL